jgi:metallo-beta-lactamase family protein
LLIPVFSIERTQDMLFELNHLSESGEIPHVPVFLDSPLAIKVTDVYKTYQRYFNDGAKDIIASGDDIFKFPMLRFTQDSEASAAIADVDAPKIIMAGSGMMNGGRIVRHAQQYLSDEKSTLLLVGYQAVGTLGRKLQDGEKRVLIEKEWVNVKAKVLTVHGYSAHKQSDDLIDFVAQMSEKEMLQKVFVVLGEPKAELFLSQRIRDYVGIDTSVPTEGESVDLLF